MNEVNALISRFTPLAGFAANDEPARSASVAAAKVVVSHGSGSASARRGAGGVMLDAPGTLSEAPAGSFQGVANALGDALKAQERFAVVIKSLAEAGEAATEKGKFRFSSIEDFAIFLGAKMSTIKELQSKLTLEDIQRAKLVGQEEMKANDEKLQASLKAGTEASKSGLAARIFGWISSVAAIIVGAVMVATGVGAVAGALMIAGGVVGVVSCAIQECAKAGLISKDVMAWLGPVLTTVEALLAVVGAIVTFGGSAAGLVAKLASKAAPKIAQMAEKVVSTLNHIAQLGTKAASATSSLVQTLLKTAAPVADMVVNAGNTVTQTTHQGLSANAAIKQADLQQSRVKLEAQQALVDQLNNALQQLFDAFKSVFETLAKLLADRANSQHNLSRSPNTI
ncbi:type III secretion system translocon subunit SctE [Pseudomonas fontis]|uniref:Type III secretion system translocon subunit SctE n=1 Tax=Pseudomonas fontis TaxID=2942633 RepID=A0ABT5P022_9PSED|nr:type III secretion system translocon subunit SctE [Pseudomonas fontis]MDD0976403.1 type III secretion system translocon subunit SctE [Pseudomonas fontis]MDD0993711.1 type III secretion system translocon subunit SctE [Pseudomonas fontis]